MKRPVSLALCLCLSAPAALAAEAPAAEPAPESPAPAKRWPDLKVSPTGQLQLIVTAFDMNDPEQNDPVVLGDPDLDEGFAIRRARLGFSAQLAEGTTLVVELAQDGRFTGGGRQAPLPNLTAAALTFQRGNLPGVQLGMDRIDYGGQGSNSSKRLLMIERSVASEHLGVDRDVGITLFGTLGAREEGDTAFGFRGFRYTLGAYNGSGTLFADDNGIGDAVDQDVGANPFGILQMVRGEVALGTADAPAGEDNQGGRSWQDITIRLGLNGYNNRRQEAVSNGYGADLGLFIGPWSLQAEYLRKVTTPQFTDEGLPETLDDLPAQGFYIQSGIYVVPDRLQLAARFESMDGNQDLEDSDDLFIVTGGLNYYPFAHDALKMQVNWVSRIERPADIEIANDSLYVSFGGYF